MEIAKWCIGCKCHAKFDISQVVLLPPYDQLKKLKDICNTILCVYSLSSFAELVDRFSICYHALPDEQTDLASIELICASLTYLNKYNNHGLPA